jgi:hypothetical protein
VRWDESQLKWRWFFDGTGWSPFGDYMNRAFVGRPNWGVESATAGNYVLDLDQDYIYGPQWQLNYPTVGWVSIGASTSRLIRPHQPTCGITKVTGFESAWDARRLCTLEVRMERDGEAFFAEAVSAGVA